jgi:hypothetical protein
MLVHSFLLAIKMKIDELSLLRAEGLSDDKIEKLKIVLAFYDRLPSDALKEELLALMEGQPSMPTGEFDRLLDNFAARVKAATPLPQMCTDLAYQMSARLH